MRIGLSTAAYYGRLETEDAAARIARIAPACCEVFLETYSEYTPAFGALVSSRLGGVAVSSVHAKCQHFEADIFGQSPRQVENAFSMMEGFLQAGAALGARVYVYHGPARIRGARPPLDRWREPIARALVLARSYGIELAWETVSWCHLTSPELVRAFRQTWPSLRFVLDIKQVREMNQDPLAYVDAMGEALCHVHALDRDASGCFALPGKGTYDFPTLAKALRRAGYLGDIILEPYGGMGVSDAELSASIGWLTDAFGARQEG